jgi:hypothetical protein
MAEYRVWRVANFPSPANYFPVTSPEEGAKKINELAKKDLRNQNIGSNAFGLEVFEDGEWAEWYDNDGNDIDTLADELWEKE